MPCQDTRLSTMLLNCQMGFAAAKMFESFDLTKSTICLTLTLVQGKLNSAWSYVLPGDKAVTRKSLSFLRLVITPESDITSKCVSSYWVPQRCFRKN